MTRGIELTVIEAVAMSPWMPPCNLRVDARRPVDQDRVERLGRAEIRIELQPDFGFASMYPTPSWLMPAT